MALQIVPLQATPNQTCTVNLLGQVTQVNVYQLGLYLYVDIFLNNVLVVSGVIGENLTRIIRNLYLGYQGDFAFCDNQGSADPVYTGLGPDATARFNLLYVPPTDLLPGEG